MVMFSLVFLLTDS